jgi:hypothetical protein
MGGVLGSPVGEDGEDLVNTLINEDVDGERAFDATDSFVFFFLQYITLSSSLLVVIFVYYFSN